MSDRSKLKSFSSLSSRQKRRLINQEMMKSQKKCKFINKDEVSAPLTSATSTSAASTSAASTSAASTSAASISAVSSAGIKVNCNVSFNESEGVNHDTSSEEYNSSDDDSHLSSEDNLISVEDKIECAFINWSIQCPNVSKLSQSNLLHNLNHFFKNIPKTASTLLKYDKTSTQISDMHHGRYVHFTKWYKSLESFLVSIEYQFKEVRMNINIDGIPLFNDSRKFHAYPILIQVKTSPSKIFCAGIYLSESNMNNTLPPENLLLQMFVEDLKKLQIDGVMFNDRKIDIKLNAVVCDAPMRADLKRIVRHNGYYSCERCEQKGEYAGGHVALTDTYSTLRTKESFNQKIQPEHHKDVQKPLLQDLGIDMIGDFCLDYMHMICLGVTKRLLLRLKSSRKNDTKCHLSATLLSELNQSISRCSQSIPTEFSRKLAGGLDSVKFWKATEFRLFIAYIGVVVLKPVLSSRLYENFLCLAISTRFLLSNFQSENMSSVSRLLIQFVESSKVLYGNGFISYNVHSLIHLPADYLKFGKLDNVSCFDFENYLGSVIKGRLCGKNKPLEQLCRHVSLQNDRALPKTTIPSRKFLINSFIFKVGNLGDRDSGVMLKSGCVGNIIFHDENYLTIVLYERNSLFEKPVDSQNVGIFLLGKEMKSVNVNVSAVHCKMIILFLKNSVVAIKMLH